MQICARLRSATDAHDVTVATAGAERKLSIPPKASGQGSAVNGGELLMLALATCFCNDRYREAARLGIAVDSVEVEAKADFDGVGLPAANIRYRARVSSSAPQAAVAALLRSTDVVAEIHNTLRAGVKVQLHSWDDP
jgi:organic hydroperoxide reductase OsmC/OhrA